MKLTKMVTATVLMVLFLLSCAGSLAEMPGNWIFVSEAGNPQSGFDAMRHYAFYADGSYDYVDFAIGYEEHGTYELSDSRLTLKRSDGGTEEYKLSEDETVFRAVDEDEDLAFVRESTGRKLIASEKR